MLTNKNYFPNLVLPGNGDKLQPNITCLSWVGVRKAQRHFSTE